MDAGEQQRDDDRAGRKTDCAARDRVQHAERGRLGDGARCAQLMLVVGSDEGGLTHPDWKENLANALKLQALLNRIAPGLCRDIDLRTERFNQHETPGSLLVEFGCTGNNLAEALRSADYLAQALCAFWDMIEFSEDF